MKSAVLRTVLTLSTIVTTALAQQITPIWVEHLNGTQGAINPANVLPILRKNKGAHESNDGTSQQVSFGKLLRYDSTRLLLYVRENGIQEGSASPADAAIATNYPDATLIWINAADGTPMGIAKTIGVHPIVVNGQGSQNDFFHEIGLDADRNLYTGHKNKIIRYAYTGSDTWAATPTCCWTEPTTGASDCNAIALDGSTSGDGNQSIRWREFRVTGRGTNTTLFCGGGTWRQGCNTQVFCTTNGLDFFPVGRLNSRDNGATKTEYSLGGQASSVVQYGWDPSRPKLLTAYTGHYPGAGYGARPSRYEADPDAPAHVITPFSYTTNDQVFVLWREENASNSQPAFVWEAAGKDGLPENVPAQDGDAWYDGNWSCNMDANASLDYVVSYSMPSWNNQYPSYSGTNYHKPGWIGVHRLDGSISPNAAWRMSCVEDDISCADNGGGPVYGVGNDWGYCGDITLVPDTNAPANLKKATVYWSGGAYGFGVFTIQNVAASIDVQPPSIITVLENANVTISATVSGSPNTYQWLKGVSPLDGTLTNLDGSLRYPATVVQGVKKPTLSIPEVKVSDSGIYKLSVINPLSGATSTINVNLTVIADTNKPTILSVTGLATTDTSHPGPFLVKALFNKRMDPTTTGDSSKYTIAGATVTGVTLQSDVRAASLGGDWREAIVQTTGLTPGATYTLHVSGVKDQTASANTINPVDVVFVAAAPVRGQLAWDYYYIGAGSLTALYSSPLWPVAPMTNGFVTSFDSDQITQGDLNNVAAFGALGDNYGCSLSGWITPKVTTNYVFFLASDDSSDLYLSSDANPENANSTIAQETSCCHGFQETNSGFATVSASIPLVAGNSYFVRAVHSEGGGGDYVKVAWRMDGDTNAASSLLPISSAYLSSYAAPQFYPPVFSGGHVTLSWTGNSGTLVSSTDVNAPLSTWTPVAGNPTSPYTFTPGPSPRRFYAVRF